MMGTSNTNRLPATSIHSFWSPTRKNQNGDIIKCTNNNNLAHEWYGWLSKRCKSDIKDRECQEIVLGMWMNE